MIFIPNDHFPYLQYGLYFLGGPLLDPEHLPGLGIITQRQLLRGTKKHTRDDFLKATEHLGSIIHIFNYRYAFGLNTGVLSRSLEKVADFIEEAIIEPALNEDEIEQTKRSYCDELNGVLDNDSSLAWLWLNRTLLSAHEQWKCVAVDPKQIMQISKQDVMDHWLTIHQKSAFYPCISGSADQVILSKVIDRLAQRLPDTTSVQLPKSSIDMPKGRSLTIINKPNRKQVQLMIAHPLPAPGHIDEIALEIAVIAFGGIFTSPLSQEIREKRGLAYFVNASVKENWGTKILLINATPNVKDLQLTLELAFKVWGDAQAGLISDQEIKLAKDFVMNAHPFSLETPAYRAVKMLRDQMQGIDPQRAYQMPKLIEQLTVEEIRAAAKRYFNPDHCHILALGDGKAIKKAFKSNALFDRLRIIDFDAVPMFARSVLFNG